MDSTIRLRQLNQTELSGYVSQVVSAILGNANTTLAPTGKLTGIFYPYVTNPNNYANSGSFATSTDISSAIVSENAYIASSYYPLSNPQSFVGGFYLSGNFCQLNQTGNFYPRNGNPSNFVTSGLTGGFSSVKVNGVPVIFPNFTGIGGTTLSFSGSMITISGGGGGTGVFTATGTGITAGFTPTSGFSAGQILFNNGNKVSGTHLGISGNYTLFFGSNNGSNINLETGCVYSAYLRFGEHKDIETVTNCNLTQESAAFGYSEGVYPAKGYTHTYRIYPIFGDGQGNEVAGSYGEFSLTDDANPKGYDAGTSNYNVGVDWSYVSTLNLDGFTFKYFKVFKDDNINSWGFGVAYKTIGTSFIDDATQWFSPNTDTSLPSVIGTLEPSLYINAIRNVGVHNDNPQYPLDVSGTVHATNFFTPNKINAANAQLSWDYESPEIPYGPIVVVDWHTNSLRSPTTNSTSVDWRNWQLYSYGNIALDWGSYNLYDVGGVQSADWSNRQMSNASSQTTLDWGSTVLFFTNGVPSINWGNAYLMDVNSKISLDWYNRILNDGSGNRAFAWNNTGVTVSNNLMANSGVYGYGGFYGNTITPVGAGSGTLAIVHSGATVNGSHVVVASETGNFLTSSSITNGAGGSGLFTSNTIKSIAGGTGVNLSGNNTSLTINLWLGQIFQTGLQTDLNIPSANTWVNTLSGSFGAGTYMIEAQASTTTNPNISTRLYAKLYDGTNAPWASCGQFQAGVASNTGEGNLGLSKIVTLTGTTSVILAAASSDTGNQIRSKLWSNSSTISGNSLGTTTYLTVCRLY